MKFSQAFFAAKRLAKTNTCPVYIYAASFDTANVAIYAFTFSRERATQETADYIYCTIWSDDDVSFLPLTQSELRSNTHYKRIQQERVSM